MLSDAFTLTNSWKNVASNVQRHSTSEGVYLAKSTQVKISQATTPMSLACKKVVPSIDIIYVNDIPFIITISRDLQFGSAKVLPDETYKAIYNVLHKIIKIYTHYGLCSSDLA